MKTRLEGSVCRLSNLEGYGARREACHRYWLSGALRGPGPTTEFRPPELWDDTFHLFQTTQFVVLPYGSPKKVIQWVQCPTVRVSKKYTYFQTKVKLSNALERKDKQHKETACDDLLSNGRDTPWVWPTGNLVALKAAE